MWVFAGGMFRSGSTLQFQLASALVERAGVGRRHEWVQPEDFADIAPRLDDDPQLIVFKTHVCKHPMRERLRDGRAIALGAHRDLRDVAVSAARKAGVEPTPEYCRELMEGCVACARGWEGSPGILEQSYTHLTTNTAQACLEIAAHLGVECSKEQAHSLAGEFSVASQRVRIQQAVREGRMIKPTPNAVMVHMEREYLHPNHIDDAAEGKWRRVLTPEAVGVIERIAGDWLAQRGYPLTTVVRSGADG